MAVASPPAHAVPLLGEDNKLIITIDMKVTVKSDDTFEASFVITDQTNYSLIPPITKNSCTLDYFLVEPNIFSHAETTFVDGKDKRVCTITTKGKISETNGTIRHENDEYAIDTSSMDRRKTPSPELQLFYAATFPGEVTQSQGGKVEGEEKNTVSFTDFKGRIVKGKDRPASETTTSKVLPWIIEGVGSLVVIGLIAMAVVVRRRQRSGQGAPGAAMQAVPVPGPGGRQSRWVRVSELVSRGGVLLGRGRGPRRDDEWCLINPFVLGARADVIFHHDRPVAPASGPGSQERHRPPGQAGCAS